MKRLGKRRGSDARHGRVDGAKDLFPCMMILRANRFLLDVGLTGSGEKAFDSLRSLRMSILTGYLVNNKPPPPMFFISVESKDS